MFDDFLLQNEPIFDLIRHQRTALLKENSQDELSNKMEEALSYFQLVLSKYRYDFQDNFNEQELIFLNIFIALYDNEISIDEALNAIFELTGEAFNLAETHQEIYSLILEVSNRGDDRMSDSPYAVVLAMMLHYKLVSMFGIELDNTNLTVLMLSFLKWSHRPTKVVDKPVEEMHFSDDFFWLASMVWVDFSMYHGIFEIYESVFGESLETLVNLDDSEIETKLAEQINYINTLRYLPLRINIQPTQYDTPAKSGCYIATYTYGSYDCPEVWMLRRFRDDTLAENILGRLFIRIYYFTSPKLISIFGDSNWFRKLSYKLLNPFVRKLKSRGYSDKPYYKK